MFASTKWTIVILAFIFTNTYGSPYIVDVVEIKSNTTTPTAVKINLRPVQPTRGVFGLSGFVDIKMDINTDKATGELKVFYSSNGISYQLTPFRLPPKSLTSILNAPNKTFLKTMEKCCTGGAVADPFVSPLEKRVIECENCLYPSDEFPSPLRLGYYKLVFLVVGLPIIDVEFSFLLKLELDI